MKESIFNRSRSWFNGTNVPGKKQRFLLFAEGLGVYREVCADVVEKDFEGFAFS